MSEEVRHEKPPRWGRRFLLVALLFALLVLGAHWIWGKGGTGRLGRQVAAYKAAGEPIEPADFMRPAIPDDQNGAEDIRAAFKSLDTSTAAWKAYDKLEDVEIPLRPKEIERLTAVIGA